MRVIQSPQMNQNKQLTLQYVKIYGYNPNQTLSLNLQIGMGT